MAERSLQITETALDNLYLINSYIFQRWGEQGLRNFLRRFEEVKTFIKESPEACQLFEHSKDTYKTLIHHRTIVLFKFDPKTVTIVGLYDARVDLRNRP